jgi:hypothetical protein
LKASRESDWKRKSRDCPNVTGNKNKNYESKINNELVVLPFS